MQMKIIFASLIVGISATPQAALFDRGNGMIYDDALDITWLQDANMGGSMIWVNSVAWADGLSFGGFDDWRLPSMDVDMDTNIVDCSSATELACRDSELGYMFFHNLMGSFGEDLTGNQGLFTNIQPIHWSTTEFGPGPSSVWGFVFDYGYQFAGTRFINRGAWAVRTGDVAVVPVPGAVWLLGSGLLGLAGLSKREI